MDSSNKIKAFTNLSDSPITDEGQDRLRRTPFIESLYGEITNLPFEDSFCFGLYGGWGEGKTSVLCLLKNRLKKNKNIILFEFDPWYLASKEVILKNFLEGLEGKLKSDSNEHENMFENYFKRLSSVGVSVLGSGFQVGWESDKPGLSELKDKINSLIEDSKKKIVIFIDDVDRLEPNETLQVFKIVKLIADFKHTIFILSMDVEVVKKVLTSQNMDVDYIDKIVQKPVPLPKIEQNDIDKFFDEELGDLFQKLNLEKQRMDEELENSSFIYRKSVSNLFVTLRNVKRYVNSLSSSLASVVDEVHICDFMFLEVIKVFAPTLYDDIYENWWFYVSERYHFEREFNPFLWQNFRDDQEKTKIVEDHVEKLLCGQSQKGAFINLLGLLFPDINDAFKFHNTINKGNIARQEKRVYSSSFLKYFTLKVPRHELPDALVKQIASSWDSNLSEKLTDVISETFVRFKEQDKLVEFLTKLDELENIITPKIAPILIQSIYRKSSLFSKNSTGRWSDSEFYKAANLIVDLLRDKIDNTEVQTILEGIVSHANSLDFASSVYILCTQERKRNPNEKWKILPIVRKVLVDRFKKDFIEPQTSIFQTEEPGDVLTELWRLCAEEEKVDPKECTCAKYVRDMLERNPTHIGKFLICFAQRWVGTKTQKPSLDIYEVAKYLDTKVLYERTKKESEDVYTTDEEKAIVELFLKEYEKSKKS